MKKSLIYQTDGGDGLIVNYKFKSVEEYVGGVVNMYTYPSPNLNPEWTNKLVMGLHDDGDKITVYIGDRAVELDYCQIDELRLLLKYYWEDSGITPNQHSEIKFQEVE